MKRRQLLTAGGLGVLGTAYLQTDLGKQTLHYAFGEEPLCRAGGIPLTRFYEGQNVVYEHEQLVLQPLENQYRRGETAQLELTNVSNEQVSFVCDIPWTIQKQKGGRWRDLLYTSASGVAGCASLLRAGESTVTQVELKKSALEEGSRSVCGSLTPGTYRFVIVGIEPYLAVDFVLE